MSTNPSSASSSSSSSSTPVPSTSVSLSSTSSLPSLPVYLGITNTEIGLDAYGRFYTAYVISVQRSSPSSSSLVPTLLFTPLTSTSPSVSSSTYTVSRRYRQFRDLDTRIRALRYQSKLSSSSSPATYTNERPNKKDLPILTSKKYNALSTEIIDKRLKKLHTYLQSLCILATTYPKIKELLILFLTPDDELSGVNNGGNLLTGNNDSDDDDDDEGSTKKNDHNGPVSPSAGESSSFPASLSIQTTPSSPLPSRNVPAPLCAACGKTVVSSSSSASNASSSSSNRPFCSLQCERFFTALASNNMTVVGGQIVSSGSGNNTSSSSGLSQTFTPNQPSSRSLLASVTPSFSSRTINTLLNSTTNNNNNSTASVPHSPASAKPPLPPLTPFTSSQRPNSFPDSSTENSNNSTTNLIAVSPSDPLSVSVSATASSKSSTWFPSGLRWRKDKDKEKEKDKTLTDTAKTTLLPVNDASVPTVNNPTDDTTVSSSSSLAGDATAAQRRRSSILEPTVGRSRGASTVDTILSLFTGANPSSNDNTGIPSHRLSTDQATTMMMNRTFSQTSETVPSPAVRSRHNSETLTAISDDDKKFSSSKRHNSNASVDESLEPGFSNKENILSPFSSSSSNHSASNEPNGLHRVRSMRFKHVNREKSHLRSLLVTTMNTIRGHSNHLDVYPTSGSSGSTTSVSNRSLVRAHSSPAFPSTLSSSSHSNELVSPGFSTGISKETLGSPTDASSTTERAVSSSATGTQVELILKQGFLWKEGSKVKSWKYRRCVLADRTLYYYRTSVAQLLDFMPLISLPIESIIFQTCDDILAGQMFVTGTTDKYSLLTVFDTPEFFTLFMNKLSTKGYFMVRILELRGALGYSLPSDSTNDDEYYFDMDDNELRSLPKELLVHSGVPYLAAIVTPFRRLVFGAETKDEYVAWLNALRTMVKNEQNRLLLIIKGHYTNQWKLSSPRSLLPNKENHPPSTADLTVTTEDTGTEGFIDPPRRKDTLMITNDTVVKGTSLTTTIASPVNHGTNHSNTPRSPLPRSPLFTASSPIGSGTKLQQVHPSSRTVPLSQRAASVRFNSATLQTILNANPAAIVTTNPSSSSSSMDAQSGHHSTTLLSSSPHDTLDSSIVTTQPLSNLAPSVSSITSIHNSNRPPSLTDALVPSVGSLPNSNSVSNTNNNNINSNANVISEITASGDIVVSGNTWEILVDEVTISDRIGSGSFGEVFKGHLWGADVAVKILNTNGTVTYNDDGEPNTINQEVFDSLKAEIAILSQLRHPNVVLYLGACTTPPDVFVVTEWCERGALSGILYDRAVPMSAALRLSIALQTAQGMAYLHSSRRGIIHRDLKSHNLLVARDWTVKVADFGLTIASSNPSQRKAHQPNSTEDTTNNPQDDAEFYGVKGTPQFMAPEVLQGHWYNGSVDVYSFGIVLCELTNRILPYSDVYRRFEFVDAVLEEGAMPTIPRWCSPFPPKPSNPLTTETTELTSLTPQGLPFAWNDDTLFAEQVAKAYEKDLVMTATKETIHPSAVRSSLTRRTSVSTGGDGTARPRGSSKGTGAETLNEKDSHLPTVLGGIEEWDITQGECTGSIKLLIESCLSRDTEARPHFETLAEIFREILDRSPHELFLQLEVPRLREALAYGDYLDACVAANEIVHLSSQALFATAPHIPTGLSGFHSILEESLHQFSTATNASSSSATNNTTSTGASHGLMLRPRLSGNKSTAGDNNGKIGNRINNGFDMSNTTDASGSRAALITRFPVGSTLFGPILPFSAKPSGTVSQMYSIPYVHLGTVLEAATELLGGVTGRLRTLDCQIRARFGLPPSCRDLATAIRLASLRIMRIENRHKGYTNDDEYNDSHTDNHDDDYDGTSSGTDVALPGLIVVKEFDGSNSSSSGNGGIGNPSSVLPLRVGVHVEGYPWTPPVTSTTVSTTENGIHPDGDVPPVRTTIKSSSSFTANDKAIAAAEAAMTSLTFIRDPSITAAARTTNAASTNPSIANGTPSVLPRSGASNAASRAAAKAAQQKMEAEKEKRKGEQSTIAQLLHCLMIFIQIMDAGLSRAWTDDGNDNGIEISFMLLKKLALPPIGSSDRILLSHASRILYTLATVLVTNTLAPWELSFITRPTGGSRYRIAAKLPSNPFPLLCMDYGTETVTTAAIVLRDFWNRFPLLRSAIAHIVAVTTIAMSSCLGSVNVTIDRPSSTTLSSSGTNSHNHNGNNSNSNSSTNGTTTTPPPTTITIPITEEIIQARYCGVILERMRASFTPGPSGTFTDDNSFPGSTTNMNGNGNSNRRYRSSTLSDDYDPSNPSHRNRNGGKENNHNDNEDYRTSFRTLSNGQWVHPLVAAVEMRLRASTIRRGDGIILGTVDVEIFDDELC